MNSREALDYAIEQLEGLLQAANSGAFDTEEDKHHCAQAIARLTQLRADPDREGVNETIQATLILDQRALRWQVELSPQDTCAFAEQCLSYNGSTRQNVTNLVKMVDQAVPLMDFGGNNPNNGKSCHHYAVGCEGSRVIYLRVHKRLVHDLDYRALERKLDHIARQCQVDEFWMVANTGAEFIYRFWWD